MKKCLIVDDDEFNRQVAGKIIDTLGFDFEEYENPFDAINKIENGEYDVVLLDWHLDNGYSGLDFIKHIRNMENGRYLPVFIYSSVEDDDKEYKVMKRDADGFISKPITLDIVTEKFSAAGLL